MRILLFCFFLLGQNGALWANEIDHLQTREEVKIFLDEKVDKAFKNYEVFKKTIRSDSLRDNRFYKLDMDGNGLTDLVVNGECLWVVLDRGKSKYFVYNLGDKDITDLYTQLVTLDSTGRVNKLVISQTSWGKKVTIDTLVYHAGGFVEYNAEMAADFEFQGLKVNVGGCYGKCPIFNLTIHPDGSAQLEAIEFNKKNGSFQGTIPAGELDAMIALLRYLQPDRLDSQYAIEATDNPTITLEISYNGRVKRISDYGERGTFGLKRLYSFFFLWWERVKWQP